MSTPKLKSQELKSAVLLKQLLEVAQLATAGIPLNTKQAALYLQLSPGTLEVYRSQGSGPKCVFVATRPRYLKADLDGWIAAGRRKRSAVHSPSNGKQGRGGVR